MLKKLFVYALAFVGTFSLTAISCEDATEDLAINVPSEVSKTIRFQSDVAENFELSQLIDLESEEYLENKEKIKGAKVNEITFTVVDNLPGGSAIPTNVKFMLTNQPGNSLSYSVENPGTLQEQFDEFNSVLSEDIFEYVEFSYFTPGEGDYERFMNLIFSGTSSGPMDYSVTMTIDATLEVGAN